jgi:hypothetical protein
MRKEEKRKKQVGCILYCKKETCNIIGLESEALTVLPITSYL